MRTLLIAVGSFAVGCASYSVLGHHVLQCARAWRTRVLAAIDEPPTTAGQAAADEKPDASSTARDGYAECSPQDKPNWIRMAYEYQGVKKGAEVAGKRHLRFVLHADVATAPANAKVLLLLRHGEAAHNVWRANELAAGRKPHAKRTNRGQVPAELHDPLLTAKGERDAAAAAEAAKALPTPELIVVSPMRRATQTALTVWAHAIEAERVPVIAHELCRECFLGRDPSIYDSRLGRDQLKKLYPKIEYERHVFEEEDPPDGGIARRLGGDSDEIDDPLWWWCDTPYGLSPRGFDEAINAEHADAFMQFVMARRERVIGVGTHSHFLVALLHGCLEPETPFASPQVFHTGEVRVVAVSVEPAPEVKGHYHTNSWDM